jgi:hypothetical protein
MERETYTQAKAIVETLNDQEMAKVQAAMNILCDAGIRLADRLTDQAKDVARAPRRSVCTMQLASFFEFLSFVAMRPEANADPART